MELFGGASKHGGELLCRRGPLIPLYGDAFMRFGQGNLRSICDVALQVQGAQPASSDGCEIPWRVWICNT